MTDEMMALRSMLEKGTDADLLREMIGFAAQRLMELEVRAVTGAAATGNTAAEAVLGQVKPTHSALDILYAAAAGSGLGAAFGSLRTAPQQGKGPSPSSNARRKASRRTPRTASTRSRRTSGRASSIWA